MKVAITGASGFIGNNLARFFLNRGLEVGLLLRNPNWRTEDLIDRVKVLPVDLKDKLELEKQVQEFHPEAICHCAAYGCYPKFQKNFDLMVQTNVLGTRNLIEVAEGIPIINVGSSSEYGLKLEPMKEQDLCNPDNHYGLTKLTQTLLCQQRGIPTLRLFSPFGPYEEPTRLIPTLIKSQIQDLPVSLINSVRDYVFIEDISQAFFNAIQNYSSIRGEIINIGSGHQTSTQNLVYLIDNIAHKNLKVSWNFNAVQNEPSVWVADIEKAKKLLGWEPKKSLMVGLQQTYESWKK